MILHVILESIEKMKILFKREKYNQCLSYQRNSHTITVACGLEEIFAIPYEGIGDIESLWEAMGSLPEIDTCLISTNQIRDINIIQKNCSKSEIMFS
jgi:hypothetical protein